MAALKSQNFEKFTILKQTKQERCNHLRTLKTLEQTQWSLLSITKMHFLSNLSLNSWEIVLDNVRSHS